MVSASAQVWEWNLSNQQPQLHVLFFKMRGCGGGLGFQGETRELIDASAGSIPLQNTELVTCWRWEAKGRVNHDQEAETRQQAAHTQFGGYNVSVIIGVRESRTELLSSMNTFLREKHVLIE